MKIKAGYGRARYKRGHFLGVKPPEKEGGGVWGECVRLRIGDDGYISYVRVPVKGHCTLIDMPVTSWEDGAMDMPCGAPRMQFSLAADGSTLSVDGVALRRLA